LPITALRARQKAEGRRQRAEGSYVDVTVYTRMESIAALPCP